MRFVHLSIVLTAAGVLFFVIAELSPRKLLFDFTITGHGIPLTAVENMMRGQASAQGLPSTNSKRTDLKYDSHRGTTPKDAFDTDPTKEGIIECSIKFKIGGMGGSVPKIVEHRFRLAANGVQQRFGSTQQIPYQTTINNTIATLYFNAGTTNTISAKLFEDTHTAWLVISSEYGHVVGRDPALPALASNAPYSDATKFTTKAAVPEGVEWEMYRYEDNVLRRATTATLTWHLVVAPGTKPSQKNPDYSAGIGKFTFTDNGKSVVCWVWFPMDDQGHSFDSGLQIPLETNINNTISDQYYNTGISISWGPDKDHPQATGPPYVVHFSVSYSKLQERSFSGKSIIAIPDTISFTGDRGVTSNRPETVYEIHDPERGRNFKAAFEWHALEH